MNTERREFDVLAVGDLNADLVLSGCWPEPGKERLARAMNYTLGSSAAIFACNAAALGLRVTFAAKVGDDAPGRFVREELAARGVNTAGVRVAPGLQTGITVVLSLVGGEQAGGEHAGSEQKALLTYRGAMEHLAESDVPDELLRRARHLHIGSYYLLPALHPGAPRLFERAKAAGMTISVDTNDDPEERWAGGLPELLRLVDIFFPNRREALSLAREAGLLAAAGKLAGHGAAIALKADADGAILVTNEGGAPLVRKRVPAAPVRCVEATGAGDSFDAGFLFRYLSGAPLEECLEFANACGALAVTEAGGTEAFQQAGSREELLARINQLAASASATTEQGRKGN